MVFRLLFWCKRCCSFFDQPLPGAARQPLTFLAPPRKVSKRRVGALLQHNWVVAPSGFPAPAGTNREGKTTRCAQTFFPSFSDLHLPSPATLKRTSNRLASLCRGWLAFGIALSKSFSVIN